MGSKEFYLPRRGPQLRGRAAAAWTRHAMNERPRWALKCVELAHARSRTALAGGLGLGLPAPSSWKAWAHAWPVPPSSHLRAICFAPQEIIGLLCLKLNIQAQSKFESQSKQGEEALRHNSCGSWRVAPGGSQLSP